MEWILEQRKCNIKMREIYWMCVCIVDSLCYRRLSIYNRDIFLLFVEAEREKNKNKNAHTVLYTIVLIYIYIYNAY